VRTAACKRRARLRHRDRRKDRATLVPYQARPQGARLSPRYERFVRYGDAEGYKEQFDELRAALAPVASESAKAEDLDNWVSYRREWRSVTRLIRSA
jgi:hypothetical protein